MLSVLHTTLNKDYSILFYGKFSQFVTYYFFSQQYFWELIITIFDVATTEHISMADRFPKHQDDVS